MGTGGSLSFHKPAIVPMDLPREFDMVSLPDYIIEPPDILRIEPIRFVPLPGYQIEPLDELVVVAQDVYPDAPINGNYPVDPEGRLHFGPKYKGGIAVAGLTIEQARTKILDQLRTLEMIPRANLTIYLGRSARLLQLTRGEHLVEPDGRVNLGSYGQVRVVGLTIAQAKLAIERHLSAKLQNPEVSLHVAAFNSKVYYVFFDGAGRGQQIIRLPLTGNDKVLDAISQLNGLTPVSDSNRIFIARPSPSNVNQETILAVDWKGITLGKSATNYQLMAGDRLFVDSNRMIRFDNTLAILLSPFERALGFTLLGNTTIRAVNGSQVGGQ